MEITPPCLGACHADKEESPSDHQIPRDSSSNHLLSSERSLPSLPSLQGSHISPQKQPYSLHQCISTLKGHSSHVNALAVHGKHLYSGSSDQQIRAWDTSSVHLVATCKASVKSLVVSGNKLFSCHQDHKIRVWLIDKNKEEINFNKYKLLTTLPTLKDRFMSLLLPKNYVQVRRHKKCTWVHHVDAVSALAVSHDGALLYSVSWDRTLKVWRASDFKCMESVAAAHHDAINAVVVSVDGFVYTGSADRTIKVWRRRLPEEKKHSLVTTLEQNRSAVNALALSSDGSVLYSGACDRSVVVWERTSHSDGGMAATGALRGHTKAILCLAAAADIVCSGSADRTVRVWRRGEDKSYSCVAVLEGHSGPVKSLAMADGEDVTSTKGSRSHLVYSGSLDCNIKVWRILVPALDL